MNIDYIEFCFKQSRTTQLGVHYIPKMEHCVVSVKGVPSVFQDMFIFQNFNSDGGDLRAILTIGTYLGKYLHLTLNPRLERDS